MQSIIAHISDGTLPPVPDYLVPFLAQADPGGVFRFSQGGCQTATGPAIPGFTIGADHCF